MHFKQPPTLVGNSPPAMSWDDYARRVMLEWRALLASDASRDELTLQRFLEQHPSLVPARFDLGSPLPRAVITQPPLEGLGKKKPDFMWVFINSSQIVPLMVEIETPHKRWFCENDGRPHHEFTQALDQISEWKSWIGRGPNQQTFRDYYEIPDREWRRRTFEPIYVLVHGSRVETDANREGSEKRAQAQRQNEVHMTFDRLEPDPKAADLLCVRIGRPGEYVAASWPPTVRIFAGGAEEFERISGKEDAVRASPWLSVERRDFLLRRIPVWDQWARAPSPPAFTAGDCE